MSKLKRETLDLTHVARATDGRLLSSNAEASMCEYCPNVHLNLLDDEGNAFATLLLPPQDFVELGEAVRRAVRERDN